MPCASRQVGHLRLFWQGLRTPSAGTSLKHLFLFHAEWGNKNTHTALLPASPGTWGRTRPLAHTGQRRGGSLQSHQPQFLPTITPTSEMSPRVLLPHGTTATGHLLWADGWVAAKAAPGWHSMTVGACVATGVCHPNKSHPPWACSRQLDGSNAAVEEHHGALPAPAVLVRRRGPCPPGDPQSPLGGASGAGVPTAQPCWDGARMWISAAVWFIVRNSPNQKSL